MMTAYNNDTLISGQEHLVLDVVLPSLKVSGRKHFFQFIAPILAHHTGAPEEALHEELWGQEQESGAGIGDGVALSHIQISGLDRPYTLFARLTQSVEFSAPDNKPADMAFVLLSPRTEQRPYHLRRLAHISRILRQENFRGRIRQAEDETAIRYLWSFPENRTVRAA